MSAMIKRSAFCTFKQVAELTCLHIEHPKFCAEICLQGAQLTQFKHKQHGDLLWLSPDANYQRGASVRGGIPICWPWFGALARNPSAVQAGLPSQQAHGFARELDWTLDDVNEFAHGVRLTLSLGHDENTLKIWPHEFKLVCQLELGDDITIALTSHNLSDTNMAIAQALHTYFPTPNIHETRVLGAGNGQYVDALDDWQLKKQVGGIGFKQEVDRIYLGNNQYQILTPSKQFSLTCNSHSSVVWNPWIKKSKRLSGFPSDGYKNMLCIESANVLSDYLQLAPGESQTLRMQLSCVS